MTCTGNTGVSPQMKKISFEAALDHCEKMLVKESVSLGLVTFYKGELGDMKNVILCVDAATESGMIIA